MWVVVNEEFHDDPLSQYIAPPRPYTGNRDIFVFIDGGDKGLKKYAITGYTEENLARFFDAPTDEPRPAGPTMRMLFDTWQPKTIGLGINGRRGQTRSLGYDAHKFLADAMGAEATSRFVSASDLIEEYLDTRLPDEMEHYRTAVAVTEAIVKHALSPAVITPGRTTVGDVRGTLRARVSLGYRIDERWRLSSALSADTLGRGGGWLGEVGVSREGRLSADTGVSAGAVLGFAGERWQQNYFGITPEQSRRSNYATYAPGAGLRDVVLSLGGRTAFSLGARTAQTPRWAVFYGASISRLLGPTVASPLVRERQGWGMSAGIVARI
jgi:hypothetical protein